MEISQNLKSLYKHWHKHTLKTAKSGKMAAPAGIEYFMTERMKIWEKKESGFSPPYTPDTILQKCRFCNIYRELDRQTIEIHRALKEFRNNFDLWLLNLAFQRFVCRPETVKKVGFLSFDPQNNQQVMRHLQNLESPK